MEPRQSLGENTKDLIVRLQLQWPLWCQRSRIAGHIGAKVKVVVRIEYIPIDLLNILTRA
jgi:hypothetical protein